MVHQNIASIAAFHLKKNRCLQGGVSAGSVAGRNTGNSLNYGAGTGLIADTHGNVLSLSMAIDALVRKNVREMVHLGDFFDSVYLKNINEIRLMLQKYRVRVVKGNNDFQVEKMLDRGYNKRFCDWEEACRLFLKKIPIYYTDGNACFSHSMPYNTIRSFYDPIDTGTTEQAAAIFENAPNHIFFCGHSHDPILFRYKRGKVTREKIDSGRRIGISSHERYIFIVGSAERGECGLYNKAQSFYERITFNL